MGRAAGPLRDRRPLCTTETCPGLPPDAKLTAFERWRVAGVPAMQVVFAEATHFW
jgi:hypothetical protein